jgi:hypothetical protein
VTVALVLFTFALLIAEKPAFAQSGGSCGCPGFVNDLEMYGRQGDQLTQETRTAALEMQNTTAVTPDSGNPN